MTAIILTVVSAIALAYVLWLSFVSIREAIWTLKKWRGDNDVQSKM